jgi:hypothetical protein
MPKYIFQWDYVCGQIGPYTKGDVIEIEEEMAIWINRDKPGVLEPVKGAKLKDTKGTKNAKAKQDRMIKEPLWDRQGGPDDQGAMTKADFKAVKD